MNIFFSSSPVFQNRGLAIIRLITGFFILYHGWEIFDSQTMKNYLEWDLFKNSAYGKTIVYTGKVGELLGGFFLLIGLFTRVAAIILIGTMGYISFFVGHGKIWYEDQHPFLFVLLAFVFLFTGGGNWSTDHLLFKKK